MSRSLVCALIILWSASVWAGPEFSQTFRAGQIESWDIGKSYLAGRRTRQEYEMRQQRHELEIEQQQLELQRQQMELEEYKRRQAELREQKRKQQAQISQSAAKQDQPEATTNLFLRCDFYEPEESGSYRPVKAMLLKVNNDEGISLRTPEGWLYLKDEIRDDAMLAVGNFVQPESNAGEGTIMPEWSIVAIDRYTGSAVIYTDPEAVGGQELPMYPGTCVVADRQF